MTEGASRRRRVVAYLGFTCLAFVALAAALGIYIHSDHVESTPQRTPSSSAQTLRDVQASHIDANVPSAGDIDRFLRRDLTQYFAKERGADIAVDFEWLRHGPTQSGVSFPKFYLWIHLGDGQSIDDRGAVRVAAVERSQFKVTDFVSERAIRAEPRTIYRVFPEPVCQRINEKLALK